MSSRLDRLYELLPAVHRMRDHEQGQSLRALLQVIAEQVNLVEDDLQQMYDNWFIETCQDWVVPYIGDLIGYSPIFSAGESGDPTTVQGQARHKILMPRREVANTIGYRRRKGTLALLEELANNVAGWPARAVEFYTLLGWMQHLNHQRPAQGRTADLRNGDALDLINGPFDPLAHTVDVRRINSARTVGRYNLPSVGLFVWRLKSYSVTETQAHYLETAGFYTFSALGNDTPLYIKPQPEAAPTHIAEERNLPVPLRRRAFAERRADGRSQAAAAYYGVDKSLAVFAPNWPEKNAVQPIPREKIIPADLSDWRYRPRRDHVAVDPVLGRIAFPAKQNPREGVTVSYHYGFSADMGGGEYPRTTTQPAGAEVYRVVKEPRPDRREFRRLVDALAQWQTEQPEHAVIEIARSWVYGEGLEPIELKQPQQSLQVRAASGYRPILLLPETKVALSDALMLRLAPGAVLTLDGLLIAGRGVRVEPPLPAEAANGSDDEQAASAAAQTQGDTVTGTTQYLPPAQVRIRHCTLVPGWTINADCEPVRPAEPSLEITNIAVRTTIDHSILGSIMVLENEVESEPIAIVMRDTILDATGSGCDDAECIALSSDRGGYAHAVLTIQRSTVFGKLLTHAIDLGENSLFTDSIRVVRSQRGCLRFSSVAAGSRTPRRYNCQPDLVEQAVREAYAKGEIDAAERDRRLPQERLRVRPRFNSERYGTPTYAQLAADCADEIKRGADDQAEMGAFHDLYQPQRSANLRARLNEFSPAGMDAGIVFAS